MVYWKLFVQLFHYRPALVVSSATQAAVLRRLFGAGHFNWQPLDKIQDQAPAPHPRRLLG